MVSVAQTVEHRIVAPGVEGSKPFTHPSRTERLTVAVSRSRSASVALAPGKGSRERRIAEGDSVREIV